MNKQQRVAPPRTREELEELAWKARSYVGLKPFERVPIGRVLEFSLYELIDGYEFRVAEAGALGGAEAVTSASEPHITFELTNYELLCRDHPRSRMTAAHELGHLLLHTGQTGHAFLRKPDPRVDLERQADIFAAAFMMPECAFRKMKSITEARQTFGVSRDAACCRARSLGMYDLIYGPRNRTKKKGYSMRRTP